MSAEAIESGPLPETEFDRRIVVRDVVIIVLMAAVTLFISLRFDLNEVFFRWTRRFELLQFDELPLVFLVLAVGCVWFAIRRFREVIAAVERQWRVEARLNEALFANRRLSRQNLVLQEDERRSIARELHDEMGQYLNAIKIDAVSLRDPGWRAEQDISTAATDIARNADHVYSIVTTLIRKLRPIGLDELGLIAALEQCVEQWRPRLPQTQIEFSAAGNFDGLRERSCLTLYRVTQEALTNIAKYSSARHVTIQVAAAESGDHIDVFLDITDDGKGVNLTSRHEGYGLGNMRERIKMHGGQLELESAPGHGFRLHAAFAEQKQDE